MGRGAAESLPPAVVPGGENAGGSAARSLELCRRAGVPAPRTLAVRTSDDARRAAAELPLPLALKPIESHLFAREFGETKLLVANDAPELERLLGRTLEL